MLRAFCLSLDKIYWGGKPHSFGELKLSAKAHSFGELKLSAEAHSFGEINLPSSQPMLVSHWRRKQRFFALSR